MTHVDSKAVILLSGGLDSTVTAAIANQDGYRLYCLTISYGQRHRVEAPPQSGPGAPEGRDARLRRHPGPGEHDDPAGRSRGPDQVRRCIAHPGQAGESSRSWRKSRTLLTPAS